VHIVCEVKEGDISGAYLAGILLTNSARWILMTPMVPVWNVKTGIVEILVIRSLVFPHDVG
jgi:hypothetical protein